jgi:hypothetical protein
MKITIRLHRFSARTAFIVAIAAAWLRGLDISCGCFGSSEGETNYLWLILRDLLIVGGLLYILTEKTNG